MNSEKRAQERGPTLRGGEVCVRARKARAPALARRGSVRACVKKRGPALHAAGSVRVQARMVGKSTMEVVADE